MTTTIEYLGTTPALAARRERPMLFNDAMVRAILEGRKTQTRRVVKPKLNACGNFLHAGNVDLAHKHIAEWREQNGHWFGLSGYTTLANVACPYGQPGDLIWVREAWAYGIHAISSTRDEDGPFVYRADQMAEQGRLCDRWRPSIHMPRWASRIMLEIVAVRVERLNDISEADARAEGVADGGCLNCGNSEPCGCSEPKPDARDSFVRLLESINGPGSWSANPWVWVVEFRRVAP